MYEYGTFPLMLKQNTTLLLELGKNTCTHG